MSEDNTISRSELLALTGEIVSAHLANDAVSREEVAPLIQSVFDKLSTLASDEAPTSVELTPAVPIRRSVTEDAIVCLEDGRKLKMLKRHLMTDHGLTPELYRARWGLKPDYPMVAPTYSAQRQMLAKQIGLGRKPGTPVARTRAEAEAPAQDRGLSTTATDRLWRNRWALRIHGRGRGAGAESGVS
ncbi:MAG TPA: MucR family transcriptional regulator [Beijerinckiaceae bacterium]|nr:MucR family transcriptional regulator [Beijerinckiaceae bacterium]